MPPPFAPPAGPLAAVFASHLGAAFAATHSNKSTSEQSHSPLHTPQTHFLWNGRKYQMKLNQDM
jgi:hypothetical protein